MVNIFTDALVPFVSALGGGIGSRLASEPLNVLDNWFYKTYGNKSELERKKIELKNSKEIELYREQLEFENKLKIFKEEIAKNILEIPEESLIIPDKHLLAIIMENSRLYLDVDIVRQSFSKLIATSMNKKFSNSIHPSHIDTVKQLTSKEAELLSHLNGTLGFLFIVNPSFKDKKSYNVGLKRKNPSYFFKHKDNDTTIYSPEGLENHFYLNKADSIPIYVLEKLNLVSLTQLEDNQEPIIHILNKDNLRNICINKIADDNYFKDYLKDIKLNFGEQIEVNYDFTVVLFTTYGSIFSNIVCDKKNNKHKNKKN